MLSTWRPSGFLTGGTERPYALLVLNQTINENAIATLVDKASFIVCADGGANKLLDLEKKGTCKIRHPDAIVGDLDSICAEAMSYYRDKGVPIIEDHDQYSTDFAKSLKWIRQKCLDTGSELNTMDVVVFGGLDGRVDQAFAQVHHLYLATQSDELLHGRIYLLSRQSFTFVLDDGENEVFIEPDTFAKHVGIIPVMGPTTISTDGLEWDVENWLTEFGGQLSTSNHLNSDRIWLNVEGSRPLMTLEVAERFCT